MKKKYFFAAAMAAMLASCSENFEPEKVNDQSHAPAIAGQTPVSFSAYTQRGITRGGVTGVLTTDKMKDPNTALTEEFYNAGFGVFAYYTDAVDYDGSTKPDFMYNQQVTYDNGNGAWTYTPVKYWPNEYGDNAQSNDVDKVTFFAYAPYWPCTDPAKGSVAQPTWGITGFSKNSANGDPLVQYKGNFNLAQQVDLCWATVAASPDNQWNRMDGSKRNLTVGRPWYNMEHPAEIDQKMKFQFKHALAQLNMQIDVDADLPSHSDDASSGADATGGKTKVYVRSVSFSGFSMQGTLNLNNTTTNQANWLSLDGTKILDESPIILLQDGRKNGKEGAKADPNEVRQLNPNIISDNDNTTTGVTGELQNLFEIPATFADAPAADKLKMPAYVIPVNNEPLFISITYDVETEDDNLAGYLSDGKTHGSRVENKITQEVKFDNGDTGLKSGNSYCIKLHLGLNSVKFDAAVSDWDDTVINGEAWLPSNTGEGVYNPNNPLTIVSEGATPVGKSGAAAVAYTIAGLNATANQLKLSATKANTWTVQQNDLIVAIAGIASLARAGTRDGEPTDTTWYTDATSVESQYLLIKPLKKGSATVHAVDGEGNESTIVITVDASSVTVKDITKSSVGTNVTSLTLYKFANVKETEWKKIKAIITQAATAETPDSLAASGAFKLADGGDAFVEIADVDAKADEKVIKPVAVGSTELTITTKGGAKTTIAINVVEPTITLNNTALYQKSTAPIISSKLTWTLAPNSGYDVVTKVYEGESEIEADNTYFNWDQSTGKVTPKADGKATIKFYFAGHNEVLAECQVNVQSTDPGIAYAESGAKVVGRFLVSDNQKTYASKAEAELWGHTPIAIVAYVGAGADTDATYNSALALAIKDVPGTYIWSNKTNFNSAVANYTTYKYDGSDAYADMAGIANTAKLRSEASVEATNEAIDAIDNNFDLSVPESGTSGWFIPTAGQWNLILKTLVPTILATYNNGDAEKTPSDYWSEEHATDVPGWDKSSDGKSWRNDGYLANGTDGVNAKLKKLGVGTVQSYSYWSSMECNNATAWLMDFTNGIFTNGNKSSTRCVRPVLAF